MTNAYNWPAPTSTATSVRFPMWAKLAILFGTLFAGAFVAMSMATAAQGGASSSAARDVTIRSCASGTTLPGMTLNITNRSSKTSDYIVLVELLDAAGNRVGEGSAWENNVAPAQSAVTTALATTTGQFVKCRVTHVTRLAS